MALDRLKPPPLCLGGSFNPPHFGHLLVARAVAERLGMAGVRLMVAGSPPHKPDDPSIAPAEHRVAMCRMAVEGDGFFHVDDREILRKGPSYTIDTARELQGEPEFAGLAVPWLIGADLLPGLLTWHDAPALLAGDTVRLVVAARPDHPVDWSRLPRELRVLEAAVVAAPRIDISATGIRARVRDGLDIRYLLPEAVRQHIQAHGLYR